MAISLPIMGMGDGGGSGPSGDGLLLETGDYVLLETEDFLLLE